MILLFVVLLGGVKSSMYGKLPTEIVSKFGYQGCLASLDVNGEAVNPVKNVLVPSQHVSEGCEGNNLWLLRIQLTLLRTSYNTTFVNIKFLQI